MHTKLTWFPLSRSAEGTNGSTTTLQQSAHLTRLTKVVLVPQDYPFNSQKSPFGCCLLLAEGV